MHHTSISVHEKEHFLTHSTLFLDTFEPDYVEYFSVLCVQYDKSISQEDAQQMALSIYTNFRKCDFTIHDLREDVLLKMREDGVMIGFLISRSLFYMLEKYILFCQEKAIPSTVEILIACVSRFMNVLECKVSSKCVESVASFELSSDTSLISSNSIIETFQAIKDEGKTVQFLNLYQGVPIICDASIVTIEGESVSFQTDRLQEIAMKLDGQAFVIKDGHFSRHLKADILYSNFLTNTVVLHNFIYLLNMPALQREFVRVHPDIVAKVYLHHEGERETSGRLYDLSLNGLGVLSTQNNGIFPGATVMVGFDLSTLKIESLERIEVEAEVMNIIENKGSYRYCMRIFPEKQMHDKIMSYIKHREKEIIQNLEDELKEYIV
jgi:hypothetical protein